jgi:hypothetical protein
MLDHPLYQKLNRWVNYPMRLIDKMTWLPKKVRQWMKMVGSGLIGHPFVVALCITIPWALSSGSKGWTFVGYTVGMTFYNARESFRSTPIRNADIDHFLDMEGPIIAGGLLLLFLF